MADSLPLSPAKEKSRKLFVNTDSQIEMNSIYMVYSQQDLTSPKYLPPREAFKTQNFIQSQDFDSGNNEANECQTFKSQARSKKQNNEEQHNESEGKDSLVQQQQKIQVVNYQYPEKVECEPGMIGSSILESIKSSISNQTEPLMQKSSLKKEKPFIERERRCDNCSLM